MVSWEGDEETSKSKHDSKEEEYDGWCEPIGESVDLRIYNNCVPDTRNTGDCVSWRGLFDFYLCL